MLEFTINQPYDHLLERLYSEKADVILLSCYIWNWDICRQLCKDLRTMTPQLMLFLGGPQVSFHAPEILNVLPVDGIIRGEGEEAVRMLLWTIGNGQNIDGVPSLSFRRGEAIRETSSAKALDMALLPFCYPDLTLLPNQIVYYESSRGCPFRCTYCLSGIDRSVRFKPIALVLNEMEQFLKAGVRQVKFCDRTFNCRSSHCDSVWDYLIRHDNGRTNFHFEITADLLSDEQLAMLSCARPGLFQFEIGVQSTHYPTLEAIDRTTDLTRLIQVCNVLRQQGNIHMHLDLIAGLPLESAERFSQSFDDVYGMKPNQLQLGFLKVLPGSAMEKEQSQFGIACRNEAPYEVLFTDAISADELFILKHIARMVDSFYNCGVFDDCLAQLLNHFDRPFNLYLDLAARYERRGYFDAPPSRAALKQLLEGMLAETHTDSLHV